MTRPLPCASSQDNDAQLDAAVKYLMDKIKEHPLTLPAPPPNPPPSVSAGESRMI